MRTTYAAILAVTSSFASSVYGESRDIRTESIGHSGQYLAATEDKPLAYPAEAEQEALVPQPVVKVVFVQSDPETRLMRFVASITNPNSTSSLEGLKLRWDALDSSGAIVGSHPVRLPVIAPGEVFTYVGGAGGAKLSGVTSEVSLTVDTPGRFVDSMPERLKVSEASVVKQKYTEYYEVSGVVAVTKTPILRDAIKVDLVLRDAAGSIVAADFASLDSAPETIPGGSKVRFLNMVEHTTGMPTSVEATAHIWPR